MKFRDIFFFDTFLVPKVISVLYWLSLALAILAGIGVMANQSFLAGLFTILAGIVGARITCELWIIFFKINENLTAIRQQGEANNHATTQQTPPTSPF
uniref:DUF4282 domain-containing protein n=1 Tax=uncultured bacterium IN-01 TaxID=1805579 RepID=A0A142BVG9_9BACT|nr:hypothetical protein [uncultured bacterium IN-01]